MEKLFVAFSFGYCVADESAFNSYFLVINERDLVEWF
jgi:hypothetical protein